MRIPLCFLAGTGKRNPQAREFSCAGARPIPELCGIAALFNAWPGLTRAERWSAAGHCADLEVSRCVRICAVAAACASTGWRAPPTPSTMLHSSWGNVAPPRRWHGAPSRTLRAGCRQKLMCPRERAAGRPRCAATGDPNAPRRAAVRARPIDLITLSNNIFGRCDARRTSSSISACSKPSPVASATAEPSALRGWQSKTAGPHRLGALSCTSWSHR